MQAWRLKQLGWSQRDIATALGVSEAAVSQWLSQARQGGTEALRARPRCGPRPKLTPEQKRLIPDFLWHGAEAYGFRGEVWTCGRVARVIREELGISYHPGHVSRLLKSLGWTPQVPITRAIQRDEEAIEQWRDEEWPEIRRRARQERRTVVFVDESGFYLLPGIVRTYGPEGLTPVVYAHESRDHLSVMGGITPCGRVCALVRKEPLNGLHNVAFLKHLLRQIPGRLLVVWDRSPIHRRRAVKDFLRSKPGGAIHLEMLPPYAPDLNPIEWAWQHLKHVEMKNLVCLDIEELHQEFHLALGRLRQKPHLVNSFFEGAGLEL